MKNLLIVALLGVSFSAVGQSLTFKNPAFVATLKPSCINLAGSITITGMASHQGTGSTPSYTVNTSSVTAGSTPYSYSWSIVSGNANISAGQGTPTATVSVTGGGAFTIKIILSNACSSLQIQRVITEGA